MKVVMQFSRTSMVYSGVAKVTMVVVTQTTKVLLGTFAVRKGRAMV
jgi:hypothetical protein